MLSPTERGPAGGVSDGNVCESDECVGEGGRNEGGKGGRDGCVLGRGGEGRVRGVLESW